MDNSNTGFGCQRTMLLVEDDEDHAELVKCCFEDLQLPHRIIHVRDGKEALDYLYQRGVYSNQESAEAVQLVLLDLRLPLVDGLDVLQAIRASERTAYLPVVILSTSKSEADGHKANELHANAYVVKPTNFDLYVFTIRTIVNFWVETNLYWR